jgi:hypothetical protein
MTELHEAFELWAEAKSAARHSLQPPCIPDTTDPLTDHADISPRDGDRGP